MVISFHMKLRIILTGLALSLTVWVNSIFSFFYSPITGVASAKALNGTVTDYGLAKFIQDGHFPTLVWSIFWLVVLFTWLPVIFATPTTVSSETK